MGSDAAPGALARASVLEALTRIVGAQHCLADDADLKPFAVDFRARYHGQPLAVVRPGTRDELVAVVRYCHAQRIAMVPQGGNTGYCGGATPDDSGTELVISLSRLNRVLVVDAPASTITLEAGTVLANAQQAALDQARLLPLSMGSEGSCQIGGNLATNAGGTQVLRYGMTRELVLGLEAVLADGSVVGDRRALRKNNTGYDLKQCFIGAEGTLGIITAATLKLSPLPHQHLTGMAAVRNIGAALCLLDLLRGALGDRIVTFEYIGRTAMALSATALGRKLPFEHDAQHFVLFACEVYGDGSAERHSAEGVVARALETGEVSDAILAASTAHARALWQLRESVPEAERGEGGSIKHDISVPLGAIEDFVARAEHQVTARWPDTRCSVFGHLGDGNVHFNVLAPRAAEAAAYAAAQADAIGAVVHELALALDGSYSAEHGIGQSKRELLAEHTDRAALALMRGIKQQFDPHGLMNPGKVLP